MGKNDGVSSSYYNFTDIIPQIVHTLDNLIIFVRNLIYSNISIFEEYGKISHIRQTVFFPINLNF